MRGSAGRRIATALVCAAALASGLVAGAETHRVGRQPDGSVVLPTNQVLRPAGVNVEFPGRANGVVIRPDGRVAAILTDQAPVVTVVDLRTGVIVQRYHPKLGDASHAGIAYNRAGTRLYVSLSTGYIIENAVAPDGTLTLLSQIKTTQVPGGLTLSRDERFIYTTLSRQNALMVVDIKKRRVVDRIAVGNAPHAAILAGNYVVVSNRGGRRARPGDPTNRSAGTEVVASRTSGSAATGTVSLVDPHRRRVVAEIPVGLHPNDMDVRGNYVFVACANSDAVSVVDVRTRRNVGRIALTPFRGAPLGSQPSGVAVIDSERLAVTLGRNNALAIVTWKGPAHQASFDGMIATGWYPSDVAVHRGKMVVSNAKGVGALKADDGTGQPLVGIGSGGVNVRSIRGSASIIMLPATPHALREETHVVYRNNGWSTLPALTRGSSGTAPKAIPDRIGDPSHIKHVFFVIKENRTYDQILGDDPRGNGDPTKVDYGIDVTPNHHALALEYPLLDNFYVTGTVSADAHQWLVQGTATDYIEEAFGDWSRSYPYAGGDAMAYSPTPFLWEHAQRHGKSVKVYGEFANHSDANGDTRSDIPSLDRVLVRRYPRFDLRIPDLNRAKIFKEELAKQIASQSVPNLSIIQLPLDHTRGLSAGENSPLTDMMDNDEAFGQIVETLTNSPIWGQTAIFVVEDDAQFGIDHVDGHRTVAYVISPYARRYTVDSTYYTQLDMLRTIEQILGLPPMNQVDMLGQPMRTAFTDTPTLSSYTAKEPLAKALKNPHLVNLKGIEREWAIACSRIDFTQPDAAPEQMLNRAIWYANHGFVPYPGDARVLTPEEAVALDAGD